ncbi:hypothetical protein GUITHDRAFT_112097 [Guillardia theta CCMP2712]|uniref:Uncharacterized protein n=1 Tax=Guillardia theta (strain CCMP2712) TaxID=905079 RepID=L1J1K3_GUITC|nr:hypothetical protein GUITHDRAFT_112097 [Guillardia theta CCMP2712]EKX41965.1 hypothetical protein GUITHDRAFT_112097 [Guillardia theta CCMP2712]|eukprot:XP_005828945.1 hypothetical protein GUITHDRAFT_112097 [Guillardia theta CCMP2712]
MSTSAIEASVSSDLSEVRGNKSTLPDIDSILERLEREEEIDQHRSALAGAEDETLGLKGKDAGGSKKEDEQAKYPMNHVASINSLGDPEDPVDMIASRFAYSEQIRGKKLIDSVKVQAEELMEGH